MRPQTGLGGHLQDDAATAAGRPAAATTATAAKAAAYEHGVAGIGVQPGHVHHIEDEQQSR